MANLLTGLGLGVGLTYFFDPHQGKTRRAKIRDQLISAVYRTEDFLDKGQRDLANRFTGLIAETRHLLSDEAVPDRVLAERVRSKMGRYVSHPGSIEVTAQQGHVILSGQVLAEEVESLIAAVNSVHGVRSVEDRLQVYESPGNISGLQGTGHCNRGERIDILQENWSPATRLLVGLGGCGLMLNCLARRTPVAMMLGTIGFGMFLRATANVSPMRLGGRGMQVTGPVQLHKSYELNAPVERVYEAITDFEKFPRLMTGVKRIEDLGNGRVRWTVAGPVGAEMHWDEIITSQVPNEQIAWRSADDAPVHYEGSLRLQSLGDDRTRITVSMQYEPPGGALADRLASVFGLDPESQMDTCFQRIRDELEAGRISQEARIG